MRLPISLYTLPCLATLTECLPAQFDRLKGTKTVSYTYEYPSFTDTPNISVPGFEELYPGFRDTSKITLPAPENVADVPNFRDTPTIVLPQPETTSYPHFIDTPTIVLPDPGNASDSSFIEASHNNSPENEVNTRFARIRSFPLLNLTGVDLDGKNNISLEATKAFWKDAEKFIETDVVSENVAKDTGVSRRDVIKKINKAIKVFERKENPVNCKLAPKGFKGLCLNSRNQVVYRNNNRASKHLIRSIWMPIHGYWTMKATHLVQYYVCNWDILDPIRDYFHCKLWNYEKQLSEVIFGGLLAMGYEQWSGQPFYTVAPRLVRGYSKLGYKFAGYTAVSNSGEVVPLKDIPEDFDLNYVFSNYGDPDGRNASLAIFPGNKDSELGFSFISKPWDPAPNSIVESGSWLELEKYHWHYVMKVDMEEVNYQLDKLSPEELFHQVVTKVTDLKDYLYFGGGMFVDKHNIFLKVDDMYDDEKNEVSDEVFDPVLNSDSDELFSFNFHGIIIRAALEENSTHTVNWNRMTI